MDFSFYAPTVKLILRDFRERKALPRIHLNLHEFRAEVLRLQQTGQSVTLTESKDMLEVEDTATKRMLCLEVRAAQPLGYTRREQMRQLKIESRHREQVVPRTKYLCGDVSILFGVVEEQTHVTQLFVRRGFSPLFQEAGFMGTEEESLWGAVLTECDLPAGVCAVAVGRRADFQPEHCSILLEESTEAPHPEETRIQVQGSMGICARPVPPEDGSGRVWVLSDAAADQFTYVLAAGGEEPQFLWTMEEGSETYCTCLYATAGAQTRRVTRVWVTGLERNRELPPPSRNWFVFSMTLYGPHFSKGPRLDDFFSLEDVVEELRGTFWWSAHLIPDHPVSRV